MPPGLDASIWVALLVVLAVPLCVVGVLRLVSRRRGGIGMGWGSALVLLLAGLVAVLSVLHKVRL